MSLTISSSNSKNLMSSRRLAWYGDELLAHQNNYLTMVVAAKTIIKNQLASSFKIWRLFKFTIIIYKLYDFGKP